MKFLVILLAILKIIGLVLGGILGLIVLLLLLILLSPVFYRGRIQYSKDTGMYPKIKVKAHYLFHIFSAVYILENGEKKMALKVFGRNILNKSRHKTKKRQKKPAAESKTKHDDNQNVLEKHVTEKTEKKLPEVIHKSKEKKKSIFKRIKDIYNNIKERVINIINNIKNVLEKREKLFEQINDDDNRQALSFSTGIIKKLLKHVLPRNHKVYVKFGMEDPALTGEYLGLAYAVSFLVGVNLIVEPDFEKKVFECDIPFKGRISIIRLLIWFLQVYRNEHIQKVYKKFR